MRLFRFILAAVIAVSSVQGGAVCDDGGAVTQTPPTQSPSANDAAFVYVGTYTRSELWVNGTGQGVHVFMLNTTDGSLTPTTVVSVGTNPTYITGTNDKNRPILYVVNEANEPSQLKPGTLTGRVYALAVDPISGALKELNSMETGGNYTMHASLTPQQDYLAVSNYFGGSVALFSLDASGALKARSDFHQYTGGSHVNPLRQEGPHMHSMNWVGGASSAVFGPDLGNDRVVQFRLDSPAGKLISDSKTAFVERPPGSGPRHMAIHPSKKFAYCTEELSNSIAVYALDAAASVLSSVIQDVSSLPNDFKGQSAVADVHISADGQFLYASNRGHDSIAIFRVNEDGTLQSIGFESTRGKTPRAFRLYGDFLIVVNQDSNNMHVFKVDPKTGMLAYTDQSVRVGTPVGLFIPQF